MTDSDGERSLVRDTFCLPGEGGRLRRRHGPRQNQGMNAQALSPPPPWPPQEIRLGLGRHYRLESRLAQATCGDLWRARWLGTDETVVIKLLRPSAPATGGHASQLAYREARYREALEREADALRRLNHPHIVAWRGSGQFEGKPVLVLELLHETLQQHLQQPVPPAQAEAWIRQLASALQALHLSGRRHLDIKPANLLLTAPGPRGQRLKLADFGACLPNTVTEHGLMGTPGWAAPEQLRPVRRGAGGEWVFETCPAADWFALGQLWFRMLTGRLTRYGQEAQRVVREGGAGSLVEAALAGVLGEGGFCEWDALPKHATPASWPAASRAEDLATWFSDALPTPSLAAVSLHRETRGGGATLLAGVPAHLLGLCATSPTKRLAAAALLVRASA